MENGASYSTCKLEPEMNPSSSTQSGYPVVQYPYSYSAAPSYYYQAQGAGLNWQQPQTAVQHVWTASSQPTQSSQSWVPSPQQEEPPPPGTGSEVPGSTGEGQSHPPPHPPPLPPPPPPAPWQTNNNYWQPWHTQSWGSGASVDHWNGHWPPSQWNVPYNNNNQTSYGYAQSGGKWESGGVGVARQDHTPPQDATPPPPAAVEDLRIHQQPRIQQYSQTGYTTELPAVPQPPLPREEPANPEPTYTDNKKTEHGSSPLKEQDGSRGGLLPVPEQLVPSHQPVGQYRQTWEDRRDTPPSKKRRSRWEQLPEVESSSVKSSSFLTADNERPVTTGPEPFPPQPPPKKIVSPPPLTPDQWPPKLRNYIDRAFAACEGRAADLEKVQQFLKVELTEIFKQNQAWDVDWDHRPLPLGPRPAPVSRWDAPTHSDVQSRLSYQPVTPTVGGQGEGGGRGRRRRGGPKKKRGGKMFFIDKAGELMSEQEQQRLDKRAQRFADGNKSYKKKLSVAELVQAASAGSKEDGDLDWEAFVIEGTSQALEKPYLRLTSAPDPSAVRPLPVLRLSMAHVMDKWRQKRDYRYTCEQFKSIRQDLTIQGIRNEFAVSVYESHARIALENGDRGEFNQCQAQLKALYLEGVSGQEAEFVAYRILYLIMTHNSADMSTELRDLTSDLKTHPHVAHALKLWSSWQLGNYCQFFRLYTSTAGSGRSLLELFLPRERLSTLRTILKAFRPAVPVTHLSHTLAFSSVDGCLEWLTELELPLSGGPNPALDCKACLQMLQAKAISS